jgi:23S rRNA (cytosine1962-C5)-methyltransferase
VEGSLAVLVNPPCVIFEDDHLLVVNKPAGWNTHAPSPFAVEGIYDWLRHREPKWASLAIIHRLDKETSGVLVFSRTPLANRSLTQQFTARAVHKRYVLLTDRRVSPRQFTLKTSIARAGERYVAEPPDGPGECAETRFRVLGPESGHTLVEAEPMTGKTHQIRAHAAARDFPILGDRLYGGTPAPRVCLHAAELRFQHPETGREVSFNATADFAEDPRVRLRNAMIDSRVTNAFRLVNGAADGWPGWCVDRLGDWLLSQSEAAPDDDRVQALSGWMKMLSLRGAYHKRLVRVAGAPGSDAASPQWLAGSPADDRFVVRENGLRFELSFTEGYSVGLFLDQRDNRRRFLVNHVASNFPPLPAGTRDAEALNVFAYTCGFSVCAARAGARVTSLDLSKKYLAWGRRNFELNGLEPASHEFLFGDAFDWMRRLGRKGRAFDILILDPPTFSRSKERGVFQVEKDCGRLVDAALPLVKHHGVLLVSANAAQLTPEDFLGQVTRAIDSAGRSILQQHYAPQSPDFPLSRGERGHLKTAWLRIG